jgi:transcriptional regulator with XRE-family HTH domain
MRKHRGLSQRRLAQKAKMSYTYLSNLEKGKADPSLSTIKRLAKALNISAKLLTPHYIRRKSMKPKLSNYQDLERAVEMIRQGQITKRDDVERILLKCFTKKMLNHKPTTKSQWDSRWQNGRGVALELVRNIYRQYDL